MMCTASLKLVLTDLNLTSWSLQNCNTLWFSNCSCRLNITLAKEKKVSSVYVCIKAGQEVPLIYSSAIPLVSAVGSNINEERTSPIVHPCILASYWLRPGKKPVSARTFAENWSPGSFLMIHKKQDSTWIPIWMITYAFKGETDLSCVFWGKHWDSVI